MENNKNQNKIILNDGSEDEMQIEGYLLSKPRLVLSWILVILTFGFLKLIFYWRPDLMLKMTHVKCNIEIATKLLLTDKYKQYFVEKVEYINGVNADEILNHQFNENENSSLLNVEFGGNKPDEELFIPENKNFKNNLREKPSLTSPSSSSSSLSSSPITKYFVNKKCKYIWNKKLKIFQKLKGLEENYTFHFFRRLKGLNINEKNLRSLIYGENSIRISLTPIFRLLVKEILSPFYIFQIFSCLLWIYDEYYYYATCIIVISIVSIIYSLYSIRRNERSLRDMIHNTNSIIVIRKRLTKNENNEMIVEFFEEEIGSQHLVPGDVIEIKNMSTMQCDALLLDGNVIVNESMLTGESIPITKTGLGHSDDSSSRLEVNLTKLNIKEHKKHILFSGTQVIQTRYYANEKVKAVVLRTGFSTTKGELVRTILFPKPSEFRFNLDLYKYIGALSIIALVGMIFAIVFKAKRNYPASEIAVKSLDLIAIVIPPALPGALTAALIYAQNRLRNQKIYCLSPNAINVCGSINTFVFDKTGTLTEEDSVLKCILPSSTINDEAKFHLEIKDVNELDQEKNKKLIEALACCHSITRINGNLAGDPLDLKLFEFTKWELFEPAVDEAAHYDMLMPTIVYPPTRGSQLKLDKNDDLDIQNLPYEIGIIRQFPFSSALQRMGVVVRALNRTKFDFYCKGSPEIILKISKPETLPKNFSKILNRYTQKGYRVISIATKSLDLTYLKVQRTAREQLEKDLDFLGLIVMENPLKKETNDVIKRLKIANIRCIMCTGDNVLTGLSVGNECGMVGDKIVSIEIDSNEKPIFKQINLTNDESYNGDSSNVNSNFFFHLTKPNELNYAINGSSFEIIREKHFDIFKDLVKYGTIFARMSPEHKQQLIEALQNQGYYVGMCGDGANDCGALKAANAGVSLSSAEASIASPFTSKNPNIECVPRLIREGRAALITSFGIVKFICMYSLTQFTSVVILYTIGSSLSDKQFLYIDLALITLIAFFFSKNHAFHVLDKKPPSNKLVAWRPIGSLIFNFLLTISFQLFVFYYVQYQPWFEVFCEDEEDSDNYIGSYENTAVFTISLFQYVTEAIIFSKGMPYRKNILTNRFLIVILIVTTAFNLFLSLNSIQSLSKFFQTRIIPDVKFRFVIIGLSVLYFFIALIFETFLFDEDVFIKSSSKFIESVDESNDEENDLLGDCEQTAKIPIDPS